MPWKPGTAVATAEDMVAFTEAYAEAVCIQDEATVQAMFTDDAISSSGAEPGKPMSLRVRVGAEDVPEPFETLAQLAVVVNLAVEGDREAPVGRRHRLVPRAARVDNRQPPVRQTRPPPCFVNRRRTPHALVVVPAVLDRLQHRADAALRVDGDETGDAAHKKSKC